MRTHPEVTTQGVGAGPHDVVAGEDRKLPEVVVGEDRKLPEAAVGEGHKLPEVVVGEGRKLLEVVAEGGRKLLEVVAEEDRKLLEDCGPRQQRLQARKKWEHLQEQENSSGVPILAVDIVFPCPTLPPGTLVDDPTGPLERDPATLYPRFAMRLHFARNCHILRNRLYPREWALFSE
jgi:hypothetical protein